MVNACGSCIYAEPVVLEGDGTVAMECHRYPPVVVGADGNLFQARPQVSAHDWCGEWEASRLE